MLYPFYEFFNKVSFLSSLSWAGLAWSQDPFCIPNYVWRRRIHVWRSNFHGKKCSQPFEKYILKSGRVLREIYIANKIWTSVEKFSLGCLSSLENPPKNIWISVKGGFCGFFSYPIFESKYSNKSASGYETLMTTYKLAVLKVFPPLMGAEAVTDCTAMPEQPAAGWKQAPSTRHPSKIKLTHLYRIGIIQVLIWIEQILHYDLSQKAEKR